MKERINFSIITVCFNAEKTIKRTIDSICSQNYKNYEYIIVDGKSTDNTLSIVKEYTKQNSNIRVISEVDKGIYDAMNKGISLSKGEWILFINADDWLEDNILTYLSKIIEDNEHIDCIYGNINRILDDKRIIRSVPSSDIEHDMVKGMPMFHQGMLVKKQIYKSLGMFDLNFKIAGDWDFVCRLIKSNYNLKYVDEVISNFSCGGASSKSHILERHRVRKKNNLYKFLDKNIFIEILVSIKRKIVK